MQAMSFEMLGWQLTGLGGKTWMFSPQPSGLSELEGGFETVLGRFSAKVTVGKHGQDRCVDLTAPEGTEGLIGIPGGWNGVVIDGQKCASTTCEVKGGSHKLVFER